MRGDWSLLTLTKEDVENVLKDAVYYRFVNDTKAILKYELSNGLKLDIVLQVSNRFKDKFMYAVFRRIGDRWQCLESGFYDDLKQIESYLIKKYLRK